MRSGRFFHSLVVQFEFYRNTFVKTLKLFSMKKFNLNICAIILTMSLNAQTFDFSNFNGWSGNVRTALNSNSQCLNPISQGGNTVNNVINSNTTNTIIQSIANQRIEFNNVIGAQENRIWRDLTNIYNTDFVFECDFNLVETISGKSFLISALTSTNANPTLTIPYNCNQMNVHDVLAFNVFTLNQNSSNNLRIAPYVIDNGVPVQIPSFLNLQYGITYFPRISVYNNGRATFQLFTNNDRTNLVGEFCFDFPPTVNSLRFLQTGTVSSAGYVRSTTGMVDNIRIFKNETCCNISITGPSIVCNENMVTYTINTSGTNPEIKIVPSDVTAAINGNQITIQNWGAFTTIPKQVTITTTSICKCEKIETVDIIQVYPNLDASFDIFNVGATGSTFNNFNTIANLTLPGVQHNWSVWTSDGNGNPLIQVRPNDVTSGTNYSVNSAASPVLMLNQFYVVRHFISFADGSCGNAENVREIFVSQKGITSINSFDKKNNLQNENTLLNLNPNEFKIYPNPTSETISIESDDVINKIEVIDTKGSVTFTANIQDKSVAINTTDFLAGTYFVTIYFANGSIRTEKIFKE